MRTFRDSDNVEWTVFEVRREVGASNALSYLPSGYNDGWLCFENDIAKRRLTSYPERWREFGDEQLTALLASAQPAPLAFRRDDLSDPPAFDAGA